MSYEEGAMMEPLAVGIHAARLSHVSLGDSVAILGAGPIGLLALQAAQAAGATLTFATDLLLSRREMASQLGSTHVLDASDDVVEQITEFTAGRGVDVTMDCVGTSETTRQAISITRPGGHVQLVGMAGDIFDEFPVFEMHTAELTISGTFRYANCYPRAIAATSSGLVNLQPLITHRFTLEETPEALAWTSQNKDQFIKAIIQPTEGDSSKENNNV